MDVVRVETNQPTSPSYTETAQNHALFLPRHAEKWVSKMVTVRVGSSVRVGAGRVLVWAL